MKIEIVKGVAGIIAAIWGFFYHFHLVEYSVNNFTWWQIPTLFTATVLAMALIIYSCGVIEKQMHRCNPHE